MNVTDFHAKEIIMVKFVEALVVEYVVAMEFVHVLIDGVVQPVTALQSRQTVLIQVL